MRNKLIITAIVTSLIFISSCIQQEFDEPPVNTIPEGQILTIAQVRAMYIDSIVLGPYTSYKFVEDYSVYAIVTMDDKSGNIYKSAYIQDATGAINLHMKSSGGLYEGDSIRLYLKGIILDDYENMLQLDSVDVDKNIVKQATDMDREPETVTIPQIGAGNHQAKLIRLENVQFIESEIDLTFSDAINLNTESRIVEDCDGNQLIVRTSGYASFADVNLPDGKGDIVGVLGQFRDDWQLSIRSMHEVNMDGLRCGEYLTLINQNFDGVANGEAINLENWINIATLGTRLWTGINNGFDTMARISGNGDNLTWLITPEINMDLYDDESLSFDTRALNIYQSGLTVWVSTDFDGGNNPETATWIELNQAIIASSSTTTNSGAIDLSMYAGTVYIAFKYECQTGGTGDYYIDNIMVYSE